eukprot:scaffold18564_cov61-Attheya_sp.AAC.2
MFKSDLIIKNIDQANDGDSWFGSVKSGSASRKTGGHACMIIKMAHTCSPKKWLEEKMKDFPGGTWIVLEGRSRASSEGVDLVCMVGYKYNKKKFKCHGQTQPGASVLPCFGKGMDNKRWILPSFYNNHWDVCDRCLEDKPGEEELIRYFSDKLAYELLNRGALLMVNDVSNSLPPPVQICQATTSGDATQTSSVSYSSVEGHGVTIRHPHTQIVLEKKVSNIATCLHGSRGRIKRNQYTCQIRCVWCSHVNGKDKKLPLSVLDVGWDFERMRWDACAGHCMLY